MAYYCAVYKDKTYVNRDLLKVVFQTGDAGILGLVAEGKVRPVKILGQSVYEAKIVYRDLPVVKQDIDAQLKRLKHTEIKLPKQRKHCVEFDEFTFFPLSTIEVADKYRWVSKQPCIVFFNRKYVALDAVIAG